MRMYKEKDLNNFDTYFVLEWDESTNSWFMNLMDEYGNFINNNFTSITLDEKIVSKEAKKYIKNTNLVNN